MEFIFWKAAVVLVLSIGLWIWLIDSIAKTLANTNCSGEEKSNPGQLKEAINGYRQIVLIFLGAPLGVLSVIIAGVAYQSVVGLMPLLIKMLMTSI